MSVQLIQLAVACGAQYWRPKADDATQIHAVTQDSRLAGPGVLFAALPGTRVNGLDFLDQVLEAGVSAVLVPSFVIEDPTLAEKLKNIPVLTSADCRRSFGLAAAALHPERPSYRVAITGTNGKTSVAHFGRALLTACERPAASAGTLGLMPEGLATLPPLTTPDPVALFQAMQSVKAKGYDHFLMEASSHGLDQRRLDGFDPQIAVFTNFSRDHLDYHVGMQAYAEAKFRLFRSLLTSDEVQGKSIVTNADDRFSDRLAALPCRQITYGRRPSDLQIIDVKPTLKGQALSLSLFGKPYQIDVPQIGSYQAHNLMAALGVALRCDVDLELALKHLSGLPGVPGRMEIAASSGDKLAIVDYAHTPDALEIALKSARPHTQGRLRVVFGAGGDRDPGKRPLMGEAALKWADVAYVTDDNPRTEDPAEIRRQVINGQNDLADIGQRDQAIERAMQDCQAGDVLVIAGKGHEPYQEIQGVKHDFDDRLVSAQFAQLLW